MVRKANSDILTCSFVKDVLYNKFVVIIGDSIQRGIYKDLVSLLQRDQMLSEKALKAKGEMSFLGDTLIEGGVKGKMCNGVNYTEVRQYTNSNYLIRFYFVTRCYNQYVESIMMDLTKAPSPDLVIMNSCLWDMTRYGTTAITAYKDNMAILFCRLTKVLPPHCLMIWNTTMPISKNARGGFLVREIEYKNHMLRMDVLEANFFARQIVVNHGFDVLDLHFWFRRRLDLRVHDGIHWCAEAHRYISELLLTHVCNAWGVPPPLVRFPPAWSFHERPFSADPAVPSSLINTAERVSTAGHHRVPSQIAVPYRRPAPYPVASSQLGNFSAFSFDSAADASFCDRHPKPRPNSNMYSVPRATVPAEFFNDWTPYSNDNFRGAQRHSHRGHRSYYSQY